MRKNHRILRAAVAFLFAFSVLATELTPLSLTENVTAVTQADIDKLKKESNALASQKNEVTIPTAEPTPNIGAIVPAASATPDAQYVATAIMVDGKCIGVLASREAAQEVLDEAVAGFDGLIEKVDSEKETNKFIYKTGTVN